MKFVNELEFKKMNQFLELSTSSEPEYVTQSQSPNNKDRDDTQANLIVLSGKKSRLGLRLADWLISYIFKNTYV